MTSKELAVVEQHGPTSLALPQFLGTPQELLAHQKKVREFIKESLHDGRDFGKIGGKGDPTLLKPGAEKINNAFGAAPIFSIVEKEVDHDRFNTYYDKRERREAESRGLYRFVVECRLMLGERVLATCIGVCSTLEAKYISRPRDCENTALKMAQKRAYVGATLHAYGLSDTFTQDREDASEVDDERPVRVGADRPPLRPQTPQSRGYDPDSTTHQHALKRALENKQVPEEFWEEIGEAMRGKAMKDLDHILDIIKNDRREDAQGQTSIRSDQGGEVQEP